MRNRLKENLQNGLAVIGTLVGLGHPDVSELLSSIGFDCLLLDADALISIRVGPVLAEITTEKRLAKSFLMC